MRSPSSTPRPDGFRFIAGDPALDFVNTAVWNEAGVMRERLIDYAALVRWGREAGLLSPGEARRLRALAQERATDAEVVLASAHGLRRTLRRVFGAVAQAQAPDDALAELDAWVREASSRRHLSWQRRRSGGRVEWVWRGFENELDAVLWPVVLSGAALLVSDESAQVRICAGPECGWLYVDRSRNGLRRWCAMETCGTREKTRRRLQRRHR